MVYPTLPTKDNSTAASFWERMLFTLIVHTCDGNCWYLSFWIKKHTLNFESATCHGDCAGNWNNRKFFEGGPPPSITYHKSPAREKYLPHSGKNLRPWCLSYMLYQQNRTAQRICDERNFKQKIVTKRQVEEKFESLFHASRVLFNIEHTLVNDPFILYGKHCVVSLSKFRWVCMR